MATGPNYNLISPFSAFTGGAFTSPLTGANGSASAPTYSFTGASNYGWFYDNANSALAASVNGLESVQIAKDTGAFPIVGIGQAPVALSALTIRAQDGSGGSNFLVGKTAAGATTFSVASNGSLATSQLTALSGGAVGNLSIAIVNNNAGFYLPAAGTLGFSTNGVQAAIIDGSQNAIFQQKVTSKGVFVQGTAAQVVDANLTVQTSAPSGTTGAGYFASNKNGAYGALFGYANDALGTGSAGIQIRAVTTDPIVFTVNNTVMAGQINSTGRWQNIYREVATKTTAYTVLATDSNVAFNTFGAAAQVVFTMPPAVLGQTFTFTSSNAFGLKLLPGNATDVFQLPGVAASTANTGNINTTTVGGTITLVCSLSGAWYCTGGVGGTWNVV